MPKTPKIENLDDLLDHIDKYCIDNKLELNHQDFIFMIENEMSTLRLQSKFKCNYRTADKWVKIYKEATK